MKLTSREIEVEINSLMELLDMDGKPLSAEREAAIEKRLDSLEAEYKIARENEAEAARAEFAMADEIAHADLG